jgi:hypothetical protein
MPEVLKAVSEPKAVPVVKPETKEQKLEAGWRYVTIPDRDTYDYVFKGIWLNGTGSQPDYPPGVHLVHPDVADALEERLRVWTAYNLRLMNPTKDVKAILESRVPILP